MALVRIATTLSLMALALGKMQDMSWVMDPERMSYMPVAGMAFKYEYVQFGPNPGIGVNFTAGGWYETIEHFGTHLDAPIHFSEEGRFLSDLTLEELMGPLVVISIAERATLEKVEEVTIDDVLAWEERNGRIPEKAYVLMHSGWDQYWGDNTKYIGTDEVDGEALYPGISPEAARWMLDNRDVVGMGADTISCDSSANPFSLHTMILPAGVFCIENLRSIGEVPECGAKFFVLPTNIRNGTAAQARAFAEWEDGIGYHTTCNGRLTPTPSFLFL